MIALLKWPIILFAGLLFANEYPHRSLSTTWYYLVSNLDSETQGMVVESRTRFTGRTHVSWQDITYTYVVDGRTFSNDRVNFYSTSSFTEVLKTRYPTGTQVIVYYDSSNPRLAVLEPTSLGWGIYMSWISLITLPVLTFWCLAWSRRNRFRRRHRR